MSSELGRRIAVTLCALFLYGVGTYVPVPDIDPATWEQLFREQGPLWQAHFWMD